MGGSLVEVTRLDESEAQRGPRLYILRGVRQGGPKCRDRFLKLPLGQKSLATLVSLKTHIGAASSLPKYKPGYDEDRRHGNGRHGREPILCGHGSECVPLFRSGEQFVSI